jgi:hypothetical protein
LAVINIAFFGWARWIDAPVVPAAASRDESVPPLQLAGGPATAATPAGAITARPAAATPSATSAPAVTSAPGGTTPITTATASSPAPTAARCRTLGPFDDLNAANVVADRLRSRGFSPRDRSADTSNPNVYWVYIGELTADAQHRAIQTLSAAGIHDAAPMTQPEQSDRLSVGVFADQAHAVRRAEQVRTLGFKPTLGLRQRNVTTHWLDFDVKSSESDPQPAELVGVAPRPAMGLGPVKLADCPSVGSG